MKGVSETHQRTDYSVWSIGGISPYFCQRPVATASVRPKSLAKFFPLRAERSWKGDIMVADIKGLENMDASEICERWDLC